MTVTQFDLATRIINLVCSHFDLRPRDLDGKSREWRIVWPRWIAITLIKRHTLLPNKTIALLFDRCYWTIRDSLNSLESEVQTNCASGRQVAELDAQARRLAAGALITNH